MPRCLAAVLAGLILAGCSAPALGPQYTVTGRVVAGPTCPVEPPSPIPGQCEPRQVGGAVLVMTDAGGHEVARASSASDGTFSVELTAGDYTLTPQPVNGLLGVAPPVTFTVSAAGPAVNLRVEYDTGIR
jgi:hypothetical protein